MTADSVRHNLIASRTLVQLCTRLHTGLEAAGGVTVVANGRSRRPDLVVFRPTADQGAAVVASPVLVVEVVSSATQVMDRFDKNVDYAETPSIQHYLMLSEERPFAVLCSRHEGGWVAEEKDGSDTVSLPAIGVDLALDDIYRRIVFPAGAA